MGEGGDCLSYIHPPGSSPYDISSDIDGTIPSWPNVQTLFDSKYIFPQPQRGKKPIKIPRDTLEKRTEALQNVVRGIDCCVCLLEGRRIRYRELVTFAQEGEGGISRGKRGLPSGSFLSSELNIDGHSC